MYNMITNGFLYNNLEYLKLIYYKINSTVASGNHQLDPLPNLPTFGTSLTFLFYFETYGKLGILIFGVLSFFLG